MIWAILEDHVTASRSGIQEEKKGLHHSSVRTDFFPSGVLTRWSDMVSQDHISSLCSLQRVMTDIIRVYVCVL